MFRNTNPTILRNRWRYYTLLNRTEKITVFECASADGSEFGTLRPMNEWKVSGSRSGTMNGGNGGDKLGWKCQVNPSTVDRRAKRPLLAG